MNQNVNSDYNQIINEVYVKYQTQTMFHTEDLVSLKELDGINTSTGEIKKVYRQYGPVEFINKCKTDTEFSEKFGLKIEERELSLEERIEILEKINPLYYMEQQLGGEDILTRNSIPTKLITVTYKDKTIESYE